MANVGPSVLANLANQKMRRVKTAMQLGLTPTTPPQGGRLRGSVPPPKPSKTKPPTGDVFLEATKSFFSELSKWMES